MDVGHIADDLLTQMYHNSKKARAARRRRPAAAAATAAAAAVAAQRATVRQESVDSGQSESHPTADPSRVSGLRLFTVHCPLTPDHCEP